MPNRFYKLFEPFWIGTRTLKNRVDELPMTVSEKLFKRALKEMEMSKLADG